MPFFVPQSQEQDQTACADVESETLSRTVSLPYLLPTSSSSACFIYLLVFLLRDFVFRLVDQPSAVAKGGHPLITMLDRVGLHPLLEVEDEVSELGLLADAGCDGLTDQGCANISSDRLRRIAGEVLRVETELDVGDPIRKLKQRDPELKREQDPEIALRF